MKQNCDKQGPAMFKTGLGARDFDLTLKLLAATSINVLRRGDPPCRPIFLAVSFHLSAMFVQYSDVGGEYGGIQSEHGSTEKTI
jgi:hypothetical protein